MPNSCTGQYRCRRNGRMYAYDGEWSLNEGLLSWIARVTLDGEACGTPMGQLLIKPTRDEERHVRHAIEMAIENKRGVA